MTTKVPSIPFASDGDPTQTLNSVKMLLDVREGVSGDRLDKNVTFRELALLGLAVDPSGLTKASSANLKSALVPVNPVSAQSDGYIPESDLSPPPAPVNLVAIGGVGSIVVKWDQPTYRNHSYAEVWRNFVDDVATASLIGTSASQFFYDTPEQNDVTYYYWVRFVSRADVSGPYSQESVSATADIDQAAIVSKIQGQITESSLARSLSTRLARIESDTNTAGSIQNALATEVVTRETADGELFAQYTVKIDQNGYVSGFGLASETVDGNTVSTFAVRSDRFAVINPSVSSKTPISTTVGGSFRSFNFASAHGFSVGDVVSFYDIDGYAGHYTITSASSTQITIYNSSGNTATNIIKSTSRVAKVVVPFTVTDGTVFINDAVIKDASISSAKITSLSANKLTAGYVEAAIGINGASIYGSSFFAGGSITTSYDSNGNIIGFAASNPTVSISGGNARFATDNFRIGTGSSYITPFYVSNGTVYIGTSVIEDASISIAKINTATITNLSAVSADMGTITAGKMQSTDGQFIIDLSNKYISISV